MATAEVRAIRQEIDDITRRVRLLQEVNEIHKEIAAIKQAVESLRKQQASEASTPATTTPATQPSKTTTPAPAQPTSAPQSTPAPQPAPATTQPTPAKASAPPATSTTPAPAQPTPAPQPTPAATTTQPAQSSTQPKPALKPASTPATTAQPTKQATSPAPAPTKTTATPTKSTVTPAKTTTAPAAKTTAAPSNSNNAPPSNSNNAPAKKAEPDFTPDKHMEERLKQEQAESDALLSAKTRQVDAPEFTNYGMDADIAKRMKEKYDPQLETQAKDWIEQVTGEKFSGPFIQALKSGVILCNLLNKLKPNTVKRVNKMNMPFAHMENIQAFLQGAAALGLPTADSFMTVDLFEEKNLNQVILALHSLGRLSRKIEGYSGPSIGPKLADKHEVTFTDEQLKKGQTELNYSQSVQKESQKIASEARKPQMDTVVRTKQTGAPK